MKPNQIKQNKTIYQSIYLSIYQHANIPIILSRNIFVSPFFVGDKCELASIS